MVNFKFLFELTWILYYFFEKWLNLASRGNLLIRRALFTVHCISFDRKIYRFFLYPFYLFISTVILSSEIIWINVSHTHYFYIKYINFWFTEIKGKQLKSVLFADNIYSAEWTDRQNPITYSCSDYKIIKSFLQTTYSDSSKTIFKDRKNRSHLQ